MADNNQPVTQVPLIPKPPANQMGATNNPQTVAKPSLSQTSNTGYKPSANNQPIVKSSPITQEGGYYQSRATELGMMEQSPQKQNLPEMSVSLGTGTSPSYGTGGIFKKPETTSYESGTSLTSTIPNIMADNNVQSAIGNVTQPVATGVMRAVPQISIKTSPPPKMNLWDSSSVLDDTQSI